MKLFLIKLSVALAMALSFLTAEELIFRSIPNDYSYKYNYLQRNASSIEILNLGSSLELNGIKPDLFQRPAFNAAIYAQSPEFDHKYFTTFIDSLTSLKVLILPLSYFSLRYRDVPYPVSLFEFGDKCNFTVPYKKINENFAICTYRPPRVHRAVVDYLLYHNDLLYVDSSGWSFASGQFSSFSPAEKESSMTMFVGDNNEKCGGDIAKNTKLYEEMINECSKRNIHVILLSAPKTQMYLDNINYERLDSVINEGNGFASQYSNVTYVNLFDDDRFSDNDFSNCNHLNFDGARKLSLYLDSIIENTILPHNR